MSLASDNAAMIAGVFGSAFGETDDAGNPACSYARGGAVLTVTAWRSPEPQAFAVDDGQGVLVSYESWEWHLESSQLGELSRPERGDRITAADGRMYEVLPPPGQQCFIGDKLLRVHTKFVGNAPAETPEEGE
jgi:hypothetical protein